MPFDAATITEKFLEFKPFPHVGGCRLQRMYVMLFINEKGAFLPADDGHPAPEIPADSEVHLMCYAWRRSPSSSRETISVAAVPEGKEMEPADGINWHTRVCHRVPRVERFSVRFLGGKAQGVLAWRTSTGILQKTGQFGVLIGMPSHSLNRQEQGTMKGKDLFIALSRSVEKLAGPLGFPLTFLLSLYEKQGRDEQIGQELARSVSSPREVTAQEVLKALPPAIGFAESRSALAEVVAPIVSTMSRTEGVTPGDIAGSILYTEGGPIFTERSFLEALRKNFPDMGIPVGALSQTIPMDQWNRQGSPIEVFGSLVQVLGRQDVAVRLAALRELSVLAPSEPVFRKAVAIYSEMSNYQP